MKLFTKIFLTAVFFNLSCYLNAQTISLINNPDTGSGFRGSPILYNNNLYFRYQNNSGNYQLAKYDGTQVSLIDNPDNGSGFQSAPIIYNNNLYFEYQNASGIYQLAKYDGTGINLVTNPGAGNLYVYHPIIYNDALYLEYENSSGISQLAEYNGSVINLIDNPAGGYLFTQYPIVYNNNLYVQFKNEHYNNQLAMYDGSNISLIPNLSDEDFGFSSSPLIYNNNLYFSYYSANTGYNTAKFDGTSITLIPKPGPPTSELSAFIEYDNKLYCLYDYVSGTTYLSQLAAYDGTALSLINNFSPSDLGVGGPMLTYNDSLFFTYTGVPPYKNQLAKYVDNTIGLIANPDSGFGIQIDPVIANIDGFQGSYPIVYGNKLYELYQNILDKYQLAKYDGNTFSLIPNPTDSGSYIGFPVEYNGNLYFGYQRNDSSIFQLATLTTATITPPAMPNSEVTIYPDPAENYISIQGYVKQVAIFDINGNEIYQSSISADDPTINISALSSGIYFVHFTDKSGNLEIKKFVKN